MPLRRFGTVPLQLTDNEFTEFNPTAGTGGFALQATINDGVLVFDETNIVQHWGFRIYFQANSNSGHVFRLQSAILVLYIACDEKGTENYPLLHLLRQERKTGAARELSDFPNAPPLVAKNIERECCQQECCFELETIDRRVQFRFLVGDYPCRFDMNLQT